MAYSTPPSPAKAAPMANVMEMMRSTLIPMRRAACLSKETARMALPIFVRRTRNWSRSWVRIEASTTMRKMFEKVILPSGGGLRTAHQVDAILDVPGHHVEGALVGDEAG